MNSSFFRFINKKFNQLDFRKLRFLAVSFLLVAGVYFLRESFWQAFILALFLIIIGYLDVLRFMKADSVFYVAFSSLVGFLSLILFFNYYPNISSFLRLWAFLFYFLVLYTLFLLNNIVLVVASRGETIPIYRVAANWAQFVILSLIIPLFTGLLKLNIHPVFQVLLVGVSCFFLYLYLFWVWGGERDAKKPTIWERLVLSSGFSLICSHSVFIMLFFAAEPFLRGLFVSSVFLLGLGYIYLYIKNSLSVKSLSYYLINLAIFFLIMILFKP